MRAIGEVVAIVAGVLAIATYLGVNVKRFLNQDRHTNHGGREE